MKKIHIAGQFFLNDLLEEEELRKQVRALADAGFESLYPHSRAGLRTPYGSEKWFEAVDVILDECTKHGIQVSIWDEDYYPSATCGNKIIWEHPDLAAQGLSFTVFDAQAGSLCEKVFEADGGLLRCYAISKANGEVTDISQYTGTGRLSWNYRAVLMTAYSHAGKIPSPHWRSSITGKRPSLLWDVPAASDYTIVAVQILRSTTTASANTDLLNPRTTQAFLKLSHETYANRYGEALKDKFHSSFFDEPNPSSFFPWSDVFADEFYKDHHWDIREKLCHLHLDLDETSPYVRKCYRYTQGRLQCENFLIPIQKWCNERGLLSIGHLTRTEFFSLSMLFWPNELRCCKYIDIPCTDPLGYFVALPDASGYHTGIKVVTSAARLFGKSQAGSDALAVMGNETSLRDLAYQLDYQLALGITYFNIHGLSYSLAGPRKDEVPPSLSIQHSEFPLMKELLLEIREKARILCSGSPVRRLLVMYPSTDFEVLTKEQYQETVTKESAYHELAEKLLSAHRDFDFIDEMTLAEKTPEELRKDYNALLLYQLEFLGGQAARSIENFAAKGGRVIVCGKVPRLIEPDPNPLTEWKEGMPFFRKTLDGELIRSLPGTELSGDGAENVFIHQRIIDGQDKFFLFNRSNQEFNGELTGFGMVTVPSGNACFADTRKPLMKYEDFLQLDDWELTFDLNSIPLRCWSLNDSTRLLDLFADRDLTGNTKLENPVFVNRFLFEGKPEKIILAAEEAMVSGRFRCLVNANEIVFERQTGCSECGFLTLAADITKFVKGGNVPCLNTVIIEGIGECALNEAPFLLGNFTVHFLHGSTTLPNLKSVEIPLRHARGQDWRNSGYGTYSGTASYKTIFTMEKESICSVDCGRVEDAVELFINGSRIGCRFRQPYIFEAIRLPAGKHSIELKVWNGPANRDRMSGLPAGLYNPIRILLHGSCTTIDRRLVV